MATNQARGSVQISEAFTYGLPIDRVLPLLRQWAATRDVRAELRATAQSSSHPIYLRVVTRVYLTGGVTVSLRNTDARSLGVDAGTAQNVDLVSGVLEDPNAANAAIAAYKKAVDAQKDALDIITDNLPGGSVRVAYASSRSVAMSERFQRPIVIGYVGFDVKVDGNGELSAVIPTFDRLTRRYSEDDAALTIGTLSENQRAVQHRYLEITTLGFPHARRKAVIAHLLEAFSARELPNAHAQAATTNMEDEDEVMDLIEAIFLDLGQYGAGSLRKQNDVIACLDIAIKQSEQPR
jgi:hypothetical protein